MLKKFTSKHKADKYYEDITRLYVELTPTCILLHNIMCKFSTILHDRAQWHWWIFFLARSEYDSQDHSAVEVKQEIEKHLAEKEVLENSIPSAIVIGPFQINTETVRQKLANKRKALANQVIELLAKKLRKQNEEVCILS